MMATNRSTDGREYKRIEKAFQRLQGTQFKTSIRTGSKKEVRIFSLIDEGGYVMREEGEWRLDYCEVVLSDWFMRAIEANEVVSISEDYFRLRRPLERRIYEIARKHCGSQKRWHINLAKLQDKTGSNAPLKKFRLNIRQIIEGDHLPFYKLELTLDDLVAEANRIDVRPSPLGDRLEAQLADDRPAFHLFLLLLDGMTEAAIQKQYQMQANKLFDLGMRLEKLGLAVVMPDNRIRLIVQAPVHFRRDGPLHQRLLKLNMDFLRTVYLAQDTEHSAYLTQTRRMTRKTAQHILARLRDVQVELSNLARRDQLTQPDDALSSYKIGIALAPVVFTELVSLAED